MTLRREGDESRGIYGHQIFSVYVLISPKKGLTSGRLSQGQSLKNTSSGEKSLLDTLRVGFGMGGVRPENGIGP